MDKLLLHEIKGYTNAQNKEHCCLSIRNHSINFYFFDNIEELVDLILSKSIKILHN